MCQHASSRLALREPSQRPRSRSPILIGWMAMALLLGVPASAAETDHGRAIRSPVPAAKVSAYDSSMMSERAFPESLPSLRDAPDPPPPTAQALPEIEAPSLVLPRS